MYSGAFGRGAAGLDRRFRIKSGTGLRVVCGGVNPALRAGPALCGWQAWELGIWAKMKGRRWFPAPIVAVCADQSRRSSLIEVFDRVWASTFFTITAQ